MIRWTHGLCTENLWEAVVPWVGRIRNREVRVRSEAGDFASVVNFRPIAFSKKSWKKMVVLGIFAAAGRWPSDRLVPASRSVPSAGTVFLSIRIFCACHSVSLGTPRP